LAKELLKTFGSLGNIVFADESRLCEISGIGPMTAFALRVCGEMSVRLLRQKAKIDPLLNSCEAVLDYCRLNDAYQADEKVHVLFLNQKNRLIADEILFSGTIDETPFYVRNIVKRALDLHASSLILVHNHPSGDPTPSAADVEATRKLHQAAKMMDITLHDHFIIAQTGYTSLQNLGLLETIFPA
jgi:DNA repair protein RadC